MGNSQTKKADVDNDIDFITKKPIDGKKAVIDKVLANPIYSEKLKDDPDTLNRFAEVLSTKEELKKSYLTTDWVETIKLYNTIQTAEAEKAKKSKSNPFSSKAESISEVPHKEDEDDDHVGEEDFKQASMDPDVKLKNKIKIKLIISEVANSSVKRDFRKFVSPVLSKLDLLPEFGMFHSGLLIGPWLIEWNNSALCVPRKCVSKAALITADLDAIETSSKVDEVIDKLAEVIVEWNIKMGYKDHGGDKSKECNCQDFVHEVLSRLGIRVDFSGPLGEFLKTLREKGTCEMCFIMDAEFREKFKINQKKVTFHTHEELDKFVANLVRLDPEFETNYKNEWAMLKSFDRSFWLRHYKMPQDKKFAPLKTESQDGENEVVLELGCPFDDPMNTYSIRFVN